MPDYKMAVVAIHGMGSQYKDPHPPSNVPTFSKGLHRHVKRRLGADMDKVAWQEVVWAQILQPQQKEYLKKINRSLGYDKLREFVVCNLSDAASYRQTPDGQDEVYNQIHQKIADVMRIVRWQIGENTPVLILAHSLGGHIMSNYIYDMQAPMRHNGPLVHGYPVDDMQTVAGFVTFGCNIPIFLFAYPKDEIRPIKAPNSALPANLQFPNWWHNFYDKHDVLGFPLGKSSDHYEALVQSGALVDESINAGKIFTSWNPLSHNAYWTDKDLYIPVSEKIKTILAAV